MAVQPDLFFRGAAATSSTTLYTVPSAKSIVVTELVITNTAGAAATYTITLDGHAILNAVPIDANGTHIITLHQVLATTKIVAGFASATTVKFHISGVTYS